MEKKVVKIKMLDNSFGVLIEDDKTKSLIHPKYNFKFNKEDGLFLRWGETFDDDGDVTLGLPEICDMEISEVCEGVPGIGPCKFCYKSNTGNKGDMMSFETFKEIFHKLPPTITQIAFGVGTLRRHPEMWDMFRYCREHGVVPNLTINGDLDEHEFDKIAELAGACAVSIYDKDLSYDAVKKLTDRGMKQINIHYMISNETYDFALELLKDRLTDPRLANLNAIVLLSLKPKGRAVNNNYTKLSQEKFSHLVKTALDSKIGIGFDSCGAQKFLEAIKGDEKLAYLENYAEPCESTLYSSYINCRGEFFPCSFAENDGDKGQSVLECNDFIKDIWFSQKTRDFSKNVQKCRDCGVGCSIFDV